MPRRCSARALPSCWRWSGWPTPRRAIRTNSRAASSSASRWPARWRPAPALLLLDEPFSNLDAATRERLVLEVGAILRGAGQTAVLVTHNEAEAHAMADHIGVMHNGRLTRWDATTPA